MLSVAGRVPADAPISTKYPMTLDPAALQLFDPSGVLCPVEVKSGFLMCQTGVVAIHDVNPGSALVPAGGIVTITGSNFGPNTNIKFKEAKIAQVRYVDSTRIDVVLQQAAIMHGQMIKATNPDKSQATYFSYQRTRAVSPSADAVMQFAVPLLPPVSAQTASVSFGDAVGGTTYGVALQNVEQTDANVQLDLIDVDGNAIGAAVVTIPSNRYLVRELSELFGFAPAGAASVRVTASSPVQVIGIAADQAAGRARAILPQ